jgi:hypothetical protein
MKSRGDLDTCTLYTRPSIKSLQFIVRVLNEEADAHELRKHVRSWEASGPNLRKLLTSDPELERKLNEGRTILVPDGASAKILPIPWGAGEGSLSSEQAAIAMFFTLITHPMLSMFGGPCCRCDRYFIRKSKHRIQYCSPRCGRLQSAQRATKRARQDAHATKVRAAQLAIDSLAPATFKRNWKDVVTGRTEISTRWLTRALNKGEIRTRTHG